MGPKARKNVQNIATSMAKDQAGVRVDGASQAMPVKAAGDAVQGQNAKTTRENASKMDATQRAEETAGQWASAIKEIREIEGLAGSKGCAEVAYRLHTMAAWIEGMVRSEQMLGARITKLEKAVLRPEAPTSRGAAPPTWAEVARGVRGAGGAQTNNQFSVRVQAPRVKDLSGPEALKEVKKGVPSAIAIRKLKSGDIDVYVPSEAARDKVLSAPQTEGIKILRRDFQVAIHGVPVKVPVGFQEPEESMRTASRIAAESAPVAAGLEITRLSWMHGRKEHEARIQGAGKTRGTLIVGFRTEEMRRRAIKGGLIIQAEIYAAEAYDRSLEVKRCFNCQQWGHSQAACGRHARCGRCADTHDTRKCPEKSVACANCGKPHKAWQAGACPVYRAYYEEIIRRRARNSAEAHTIRTQEAVRASQKDSETFTFVARRKRAAPPSPPSRRVGRPSGIEVAGRERSQARLLFAEERMGNAGPAQVESAPLEDDDEDMDKETS